MFHRACLPYGSGKANLFFIKPQQGKAGLYRSFIRLPSKSITSVIWPNIAGLIWTVVIVFGWNWNQVETAELWPKLEVIIRPGNTMHVVGFAQSLFQFQSWYICVSTLSTKLIPVEIDAILIPPSFVDTRKLIKKVLVRLENCFVR